MAERVRVVVAEDDFLVRAGIETVLAGLDGVEVVASCGSLPELLVAVDATEPDVVLTDIRMPPDGLDEGIRAATALRATHPRIGVLVLSLYLDVSAALTLVERGAARRGYLLKQRLADADELQRALRAVASGQSYMDDEVVTRLFAARRASGLDRLTAREAEVLGEMAGGRSNGAIAERLGIGRRAVEKHINSIFSKLDLTDAIDSDRRVRSVLLWLADGAHGGGASTIADVTGR